MNKSFMHDTVVGIETGLPMNNVNNYVFLVTKTWIRRVANVTVASKALIP